jgi:hypothetical protein
MAHQVLKTVFVLLSRQVPYRDSTVDYEALVVKRHAPRWIRQLKKFGCLPQRPDLVSPGGPKNVA